MQEENKKQPFKQKLKKSWSDTYDFIFHQEKWERKNVEWMFCKYCGHKENRHESYRGICRECWWDDKPKDKVVPCHEFNREPKPLLIELQNIMPNARFMDDTYYMYIATKKVNVTLLKEIEKIYKWKIKSIQENNNEIWITIYKTQLFCIYCNQPMMSLTDKMEHESSVEGLGRCSNRPDEVTFASKILEFEN